MSSRCLSDIQTLAIVPNFNIIFYCDSLEIIIVGQIYKTTVTQTNELPLFYILLKYSVVPV